MTFADHHTNMLHRHLSCSHQLPILHRPTIGPPEISAAPTQDGARETFSTMSVLAILAACTPNEPCLQKNSCTNSSTIVLRTVQPGRKLATQLTLPAILRTLSISLDNASTSSTFFFTGNRTSILLVLLLTSNCVPIQTAWDANHSFS